MRTTSRTGGRRKLDPDPRVHADLIAAATELIRVRGVQKLAVTDVLQAAGLGTRAFYRHFTSKDKLVAEVFLAMARLEVERLRARMATAADPVRSIAAWIDARLDLAFSADIRTDLRAMSVEAQNQIAVAPGLIAPAYRAIMLPLTESLTQGMALGFFHDIDPDTEALSIQGVVWSNVERQWSTTAVAPAATRQHIQRFCLRGLGVSAELIDAVLHDTTG